MGRLKKIIKGIGSGLVSLGRAAEKSIGSFERIFGEIEGPDRGIASQNLIMSRAASDSGGKDLEDMVSLRKTNRKEEDRRRFI